MAETRLIQARQFVSEALLHPLAVQTKQKPAVLRQRVEQELCKRLPTFPDKGKPLFIGSGAQASVFAGTSRAGQNLALKVMPTTIKGARKMMPSAANELAVAMRQCLGMMPGKHAAVRCWGIHVVPITAMQKIMPVEDYEMLVSKKPDAVIVIVADDISGGDMYEWTEHDATVQFRIARELFKTVTYVNQDLDMLYSDSKPGNFLVAGTAEEPIVLASDFGGSYSMDVNRCVDKNKLDWTCEYARRLPACNQRTEHDDGYGACATIASNLLGEQRYMKFFPCALDASFNMKQLPVLPLEDLPSALKQLAPLLPSTWLLWHTLSALYCNRKKEQAFELLSAHKMNGEEKGILSYRMQFAQAIKQVMEEEATEPCELDFYDPLFEAITEYLYNAGKREDAPDMQRLCILASLGMCGFVTPAELSECAEYLASYDPTCAVVPYTPTKSSPASSPADSDVDSPQITITAPVGKHGAQLLEMLGMSAAQSSNSNPTLSADDEAASGDDNEVDDALAADCLPEALAHPLYDGPACKQHPPAVGSTAGSSNGMSASGSDTASNITMLTASESSISLTSSVDGSLNESPNQTYKRLPAKRSLMAMLDAAATQLPLQTVQSAQQHITQNPTCGNVDSPDCPRHIKLDVTQTTSSQGGRTAALMSHHLLESSADEHEETSGNPASSLMSSSMTSSSISRAYSIGSSLMDSPEQTNEESEPAMMGLLGKLSKQVKVVSPAMLDMLLSKLRALTAQLTGCN